MKETLAFFNNKGGVGKTTVACNYAHYAAKNNGWKVLLVDADPQANATQLLLEEELWNKIYSEISSSATKTILKVFENIKIGDAGIDPEVIIHKSERFNIDVIAGHPSLSSFEDRLSRGWSDIHGEDAISGLRKSNWLHFLRESDRVRDYDLVIVDAGPSLGAINRSMLLGSTKFITPVTSDLFSLYALENINEWINGKDEDEDDEGWADIYLRAVKPKYYKYNIQDSVPIQDGYIGYTVQEYQIRSSNGAPIKAYEKYKDKIDDKARKLAGHGNSKSLDLGIIPQMFSMIARGQSAHAPISELSSKDGIIGAQYNQRDKYVEQLNVTFERISKKVQGD